MHHRRLAASAALVAVLALAGCAGDAGEPTHEQLRDACLDIFATSDDPAGYCADALELIETDPTSGPAQDIYDTLVDHIENP